MTLIITPDNTDFAAYMAETEPQVKVMPAETWENDLLRSNNTPERLRGARLPWAKTHDLIRFRPGEVTLWQGINGHGKSQLLGQVALGFAAQNQKICIASFEMKPVATLKRMLRQTAMNETPGETAVRTLMRWATGRVWIYDQLGNVRTDALAAVIRYASQKLGADHFVVDSLMKCVRGTDDYNGQKDFVDMLCTLARDHNLHIHLVHHAKKQEDESKAPGKFSGSGSHAITDQVDQIMTVWRNKPKEKNVEKALRVPGGSIPQELIDAPDARLICDKNRHGEWEGSIGLWFHSESLQYTADSRRMPLDIIGRIA